MILFLPYVRIEKISTVFFFFNFEPFWYRIFELFIVALNEKYNDIQKIPAPMKEFQKSEKLLAKYFYL